MEFYLTDPTEDFALLDIIPSRDDFFSVGGHNDGKVTISLPLYTHEARLLIETLQPLLKNEEEENESGG